MIYPRLVLSFRGYQALSGGLYVDSGGARYPRSHGHLGLASGTATDGGEYELSGMMSLKGAQHARGQSC